MMDPTTLAKLATDELASQEIEATPPSAEVRANALAAMTAAYRARIVRSRRNRVTGALALAAAAAITIVAVRARRHVETPVAAKASERAIAVEVREHTGAVSVVRGDQSLAVVAATSLAIDDRVRVGGDGSASIVLSTGTAVALEANADVTFSIAAPSQVVTLSEGAAMFRVAKLTGPDRFIVRTADAEVEVRGTRFRVAKVTADAKCGEGTTTRVDVLEGIVVVRDARGSSDVAAGGAWPTGCVTALAPTPTPMPAEKTNPIPKTATTTASPIAAGTSALAAQNDLFTRALQEKQQGNAAAALADLDTLLVKYPGGPLSENAEVERMRLLHGDAAIAAAKAYLAHHPQGYARVEAETILTGAL